MAVSTLTSDILLLNGKRKSIKDLKVGDIVDTLDQHTFNRGNHKVISVTKETSKLLDLDFSGEKVTCSPNHKFYSVNRKKWIKAKDLSRGNTVATIEGEVSLTNRKKTEKGDVVHLTVEDAHTYISGKFLVHNKGNTTINYPKEEKDTTFQDYLKSETRKSEDREYKDWVNQLQTYKSAKGKQSSGRSGWDAFRQGVQTKLGKGLIDYNQAETQLKDYARDYNLAGGSLSFTGGEDPRKGWDRYKDNTDFQYTDVDTYQTPERWKNWSVNTALNNLGTFYHGGGGDITTGSGTSTPATGNWLEQYYKNNNIGGQGGSLDANAKAYWEGQAATLGQDKVKDIIKGTAQKQGTWGGPSATSNITLPSTTSTDYSAGGLLGKRRDTNIKAAYEEILGRQGTADEIAKAKERFTSGYYKDIDSFKTGLTSGSEYKDKFQRSYLENYYDTMYGKEERDASGARTGTRTFNFDKSLLPSYQGDLEKDTGVKMPTWKDQYKGTPAEIDFAMDNIRESRKFLYSAGLTNLQGNIDKEVTKLKVEGNKEITRIGKEGDVYAGVVNAFSF
jgi:hypothetical protein